jgi:MFS family permease
LLLIKTEQKAMLHILNSNRGILSWGLVALFFFYDYLLKFSVSVLKPTLMVEFNITATVFAWVIAMYMLMYTVMQIPAGILVDRWGTRRIITLAALACGAGCFLFSKADTTFALFVGRALIGFGASFALVTCSKLAAIWFNPNRFALLFGSMVTVAFLGGVFGINLSTYLLSLYGWRSGMELAGVGCIVIAAVMWWIIRDNNPNNPQNDTDKKISLGELFYQLLEVAQNKQSWLSAIYAGLMFVPTTILAFWGTAYLSETNNLSLELAGGLSSTIFAGWIFGSPAYGYISDRLGKRKILMFVSALSTLCVSSILIYTTGLSYITIAILMFLVGFCSSGFALAFTALKENYSVTLVGAAMGFMNTINTLFESLSVIVVGQVIDLQLGATLCENYQYALMFIPASTILALITLLFIRAR